MLIHHVALSYLTASTGSELNLKTYPSDQSILQGEEQQQCIHLKTIDNSLSSLTFFLCSPLHFFLSYSLTLFISTLLELF